MRSTRKYGAFALALALALIATPVSAAADRAIIEGFVGSGQDSEMVVYVNYMDGADQAGYYGSLFYLDGVYTQEDFVEAAEAVILDYASANNYSLSNGILWPYSTVESVQAAIEATPSTQARLVTGTVAGGAGAVSIDISGLGFSEITHVVWEPVDDTALYSFGSLATSTSEVSAVVKKQTTTTGNVLTNLLGGLTSVVTGISQQAAPNGTAVRALVIGK